MDHLLSNAVNCGMSVTNEITSKVHLFLFHPVRWLVSNTRFGGVAPRRGCKNASEFASGDTLDIWRVTYAIKSEKRLLLYAEMKLPGEAGWNLKSMMKTAEFGPGTGVLVPSFNGVITTLTPGPRCC